MTLSSAPELGKRITLSVALVLALLGGAFGLGAYLTGAVRSLDSLSANVLKLEERVAAAEVERKADELRRLEAEKEARRDLAAVRESTGSLRVEVAEIKSEVLAARRFDH